MKCGVDQYCCAAVYPPVMIVKGGRPLKNPAPSVAADESDDISPGAARHVLSVRELAGRSGIAPATVYQIEPERTDLHYRSIRVLREAIRVDPMQIVEFARVVAEGGTRPKSQDDPPSTKSRRHS
jgi:hypothetical protein